MIHQQLPQTASLPPINELALLQTQIQMDEFEEVMAKDEYQIEEESDRLQNYSSGKQEENKTISDRNIYQFEDQYYPFREQAVQTKIKPPPSQISPNNVSQRNAQRPKYRLASNIQQHTSIKNKHKPNKKDKNSILPPRDSMPHFTLSFLAKAKLFFANYEHNLQQGTVSSDNSLRKFALQNGYARSSTYYLYKKWLIDKDLRIIEEAIKNGIFNPNYRGRSKSTFFRLDIVYRIIDRNPFLQAKQVAQLVQQDPRCVRIDSSGNPIAINQKMINRIFTYQKIKRIPLTLFSSLRNNPQDLQRRKLYCQNLVHVLQNRFKVFYIDEMIVNRWIVRSSAWGRENQAFINAMINLRTSSFLIVAIMNEKGAVKFEVLQGSAQKQRYQQLLQRLINKATIAAEVGRLLVIHSAVGNEIKNLMREQGEKLGYRTLILPPLSSQLSPLVGWFVWVRSLIKKHKFESEIQLIDATRKVLSEQIGQKKVPDFISSIERYVNKGLNSMIF